MINAAQSKLSSIINRIKARWDGSLYSRIAFSLIFVMLVMVILLGTITGITIYYSVTLKESAALKSRLDILSSDIEHRINGIVYDTENLAKNTLVMNALVDTYGRDSYLIPFLRGHKTAEGMPHIVGLCDFQGAVIASNMDKPLSFGDEELLGPLVAKGTPVARIEKHGNSGDNHLVICHPVIYPATGTAEGFLVIDVLMKDLFAPNVPGDANIAANIFQGDRLIAGKGSHGGISMRKELKLAGAASGLNFAVEVKTPRTTAIIWFVGAMFLITAVMVWLIFKISYRISDSLTKRLVLLNDAAQSISESGVPDRKVSLTGTDEVKHLADSFNRMVDQLHASYDALEGRVEERTRLLVIANQNLKKEIDQRQEAEYRLKELNENLEETIKNEIEQRREKEKLLIQQNRLAAMGEMIGNIAHQWRQPLNNLGLLIQNFQVEYESGTISTGFVEEEVAKVMDCLQYMSHTIDDFRSFYRPDKEKQPFRIIDTVSRVVSLVRPALTSCGIEVRIIDDDRGEVLGYANEFGQVLMNLLNNAKDAIQERKPDDPCIEIQCFRDGERSVVVVRDNAGGIDETLIDKVFDPYFTTKFKNQGTGIGLYMAKIIIENNMEGVLTVSNSEFGAEFRIEI